MAKSGSITTNEKEGRSITLSWSLSSQDVANNTSTIAWTLKGSGSGSGWVMSGAFKAVINGTTVYSSDTRIQLYNNTTIASGTAKISHNSDGTKSFSLSCEAGVYTYAVSVTASGTHSLVTVTAGVYIISANLNFAAATAKRRGARIQVSTDGGTTYSNLTNAQILYGGSTTSQTIYIHTGGIASTTSSNGLKIKLQAYQDTGAAINITSSYLRVVRIA